MEKEKELVNMKAEEEFKNMPLKFCQIYDGMWVWDGINQKDIQVFTVEKRHHTKFISFVNGVEVIFQPGRFFRSEKEC